MAPSYATMLATAGNWTMAWAGAGSVLAAEALCGGAGGYAALSGALARLSRADPAHRQGAADAVVATLYAQQHRLLRALAAAPAAFMLESADRLTGPRR